MGKEDSKNTPTDTELDDELFLKKLGIFLKKTRIAAGFPTIRSFTDTMSLSYSQYQGYESGKNITIKTLKQLLKKLNIRISDWFNIELLDLDQPLPEMIDSIIEAQVSQVISQVRAIDGRETANSLSATDAKRYADILISCHIARTRSYILKDVIKLDDSHNTFKRVAGKLLEYKWIEYTGPRNSPKQQYITTEAGKNVLRLSE